MGLLDDNLDISVEVLEKVMILDLIHCSDYVCKDQVTMDNLAYKKQRKVKDPWMYVLTIGFDDGKHLVKWEHMSRIQWRRPILHVDHHPVYLREFQKSKESYCI